LSLGEVVREALGSGRYLALGSMDGVLASLGAVLGTSASGSADAAMTAGLSVAVALAMSNGFGSYLGERVEELRELRELERKMVVPEGGLNGTLVHKLARLRIYASVVSHGGSSFVAALVPVVPFLILGDARMAAEVSMAVSGAFLFLLGVYLGRTCGESGFRLILRGLETLAVGVLVGLITHIVGASG